ncbi:MAG: PQQ-binding-like beta-propeller repeat protein, partial [Prosthecobacter sp.]|nr:PQQ-binding-like beta-propeller repeat protein [Prosthecobacter sp.]
STLFKNKLEALNASTGVSLWSSSLTNSTAYMHPAVDEMAVYTHRSSSSSRLDGFTRSSGDPLFTQGVVESYPGAPTLYEDGLYSFAGGILTRHEKSTGAVLWSMDFGWSGETLMNRTITCSAGYAYLVNDSITSPAGQQELICVNLTDHTVVWRVQGIFKGTPATAHQTVYVISNSAVSSYDAATGTYLGDFRKDGYWNFQTQPIVTLDTLIVSAPGGGTHLYNLSDHSLRQEINFGGGISLAGETLYIASSTGKLLAYAIPKTSNSQPVAQAQTASTEEEQALTLTLQATDTNSDALRFIITSLPAEGTLYQTTDGVTPGEIITELPTLVTNDSAQVIYLPPANQNGSPLTTFQFAAGDGISISNKATVTLNVQAVNDAPLARDDVRHVEPGQILSPLNVRDNDSDAEDSLLVISSFTQPQFGTVQLNENDSLSYQASSSVMTGTDQFTYTVRENQGLTATATVRIEIGPWISPSWPTFGNGPDHTSYSPGRRGTSAWTERWSYSFSTSTGPKQAVTCADGRVFFAQQTSYPYYTHLFALDLAKGSLLWKRSFNFGSKTCQPTAHAGCIYWQYVFPTGQAYTYVLNSQDGTDIRDSYRLTTSKDPIPLTVSDLGIFCQGGDQSVFNDMGFYGFDLDSGDQLFRQTKGTSPVWTPSIVDSELYAFTEGEFSQHDPVTGQPLWKQSTGWSEGSYGVSTTAALQNRRAYFIDHPSEVASVANTLTCIDLDSHNIVWTVSGAFDGTPAVSNDHVYALREGSLVSYQALDGRLQASFTPPIGNDLKGLPVVTDDLVIVTSTANTYILDRTDLAQLQIIPTGGYASIAEGSLIIFDLTQKKVSTWTNSSTPLIIPAGGTFDQPVAVTVGKVEPDTYIYYTLDGRAPNLDSRSFVSGSTVTLDASAQLRVISVKGSDVSSIQQATFTLPDSDNDGLPDWWEMQHFGLVTAASEETDNDLDGMSDLEEFLTGTDPRAAADSFIGRVMSDDGTVTLTWSSKAGRIYTIETSPDLVHWTPATAEIRGTGSPLQHTLNSGGESRAFSRIRALRDLAVP